MKRLPLFLTFALLLILACNGLAPVTTEIPESALTPTSTVVITSTSTLRPTSPPRPPTATTEPTVTALPMAMAAVNDEYEVKIITARRLDQVFITRYLIYTPSDKEDAFLELGIKVTNLKPSAHIKLNWGDFYIISTSRKGLVVATLVAF